jgi:hypothetical protein
VPATVTTTQLGSFTADGYLVVPDLVPAATIDRLRRDAAALLAESLDRMATTERPDPRVTWWRLASGRPYVLKIKPVVDLIASAAALADSPDLTAVVGDLLGGTPGLMENKIMYKQVVDVPAGWTDLPTLGDEVCKHTDAAYFAARGYHRVLTVAVCLDACTESAGALRVWPGSHRRPIELRATTHQGPVVPDDAAPDADAVTLLGAPGTVLAWDAALVHASGPNTSGHPRRLLVLGFAPAGGRR